MTSKMCLQGIKTIKLELMAAIWKEMLLLHIIIMKWDNAGAIVLFTFCNRFICSEHFQHFKCNYMILLDNCLRLSSENQYIVIVCVLII